MKVELKLTIKLTPESRGEMIDSFGARYREFREGIEKQIAESNIIQLPANATQVRWLLESGRWE